MTIKSWFLQKNFDNNERLVINTALMGNDIEIVKETEKAVFVKFNSDYGIISSWIPKSCVGENYNATEIAPEKKQNSGLAYNETLVEFAKAHGVKGVRIGLKTTTLISKIIAAGLEVPARA